VKRLCGGRPGRLIKAEGCGEDRKPLMIQSRKVRSCAYTFHPHPAVTAGHFSLVPVTACCRSTGTELTSIFEMEAWVKVYDSACRDHHSFARLRIPSALTSDHKLAKALMEIGSPFCRVDLEKFKEPFHQRDCFFL
jgi:hypothetical protein